MNNKNIFTENEKVIFESLKQELRWIARDKDGSLFVYKAKPERCDDWFGVHSQDIYEITMTFRFSIGVFNHLFKNVTWENGPICFKPQVLDKVERRYLKTVFRPFHKRIISVCKKSSNDEEIEWLFLHLKPLNNLEDYMTFPMFEAGTMYKNMELNKNYTLEELGIKYD